MNRDVSCLDISVFPRLFHIPTEWSGEVMNNIIYLVGAVVIVLFILSFIGMV
ncbi:hypothetical protein HNO86_23920 [Pseudomonas sp. C1C7]|uniref:hypothetical protein n=1 Tax=Pseudomonas sp. C1C7 TaxID=2735272 RepID=UPI001586F18C|nr:hypothetical protein [Pseudomonas sp. C1C7]NUT78094.1 hypothetical protein [Pseudomonas sp. C1C7]